jgi:pimeloyl-ACP methyl ester carboxylesterase
VQTHVNGELRQDATSDDLIFSIPTLISTISAGQTIQPGDVIATGTVRYPSHVRFYRGLWLTCMPEKPAGVGIGKKPPVYLQPGDEVSITVTGLGTLRSKIASPTAPNPPMAIPTSLSSSSPPRVRGELTTINSKPMHYQRLGTGPKHIVFVHGLGGTSDIWRPLISTLSLTSSSQNYTCHIFDLEGHGLSPAHPLSIVSLSSLASDLAGVLALTGADATNLATVVAHSMGCLAAVHLALSSQHPGSEMVGDLILLGPPASPLPQAACAASLARAHAVRRGGMAACVDAAVEAGTSRRSKRENPVGVAAVRLSLLGQDPEGYAKGCLALAGTGQDKGLEVEKLGGRRVLFVTGEEDKVSPPELCQRYAERVGEGAEVVVLKGTGHWLVYEDLQGVGEAVRGFL